MRKRPWSVLKYVMKQLALMLGEREEGELPLSHTQTIESLLLTKKDMINKQLKKTPAI